MEDRQTGNQPDAEMMKGPGVFPPLLAGLIAFIFFFSLPVSGRAGSWETLGGWETDSYAEGYGFIAAGAIVPVAPGWTFLARATGSRLYYHFTDNTGYHEISSPGFGSSIGLRREWERLSLTLSGGVERRWTTDSISSLSQTTEQFYFEDGAVVQGDARANFASVWVTDLLINYSGANRYYFSRGEIQREVISGNGIFTLSLGVEGIGQGNQDVVSGQEGLVVETNIVPIGTSVSFRAGYKRSWFPEAPIQDGPYFGVGFYKGFN